MVKTLISLGCVALLAGASPASAVSAGEAPEANTSLGQAIYEGTCAACHEAGVPKAPTLGMLRFMAPGAIYKALTEGVMAPQVPNLSLDDKRAVVEYITGRPFTGGNSKDDFLYCEGDAAQFDFDSPPQASGWGVSPDNKREFTSRHTRINAENIDRLKLKWAFGFPDAVRARSHPSIAGGAVHVGSQDGSVFSLDKESGCVRWIFRARSEVRTAIVMSPWKAGDTRSEPTIYFGDYLGNVYAVNAITGEGIWQQRPDSHPNATITGAPALHHGRLYVPVSSLEVITAANPDYACCTFRGSVVAYDAATGEQLWKTYTIPEKPKQVGTNAQGAAIHAPSGAPIWNSPAIDIARGQLYVGTGENYSSPANGTSDSVIAMDLDTGKVNWVFQATAGDAWNSACEVEDKTNCPEERGPDFDFGAATILAKSSSGQEFVLAGQKSGVVWALNPDTGKLKWQRKVGMGSLEGGVHFGMAVSGDRVFVPISDAFRSEIDKRDVEPSPGLFALDLNKGEFIWQWHANNSACGGKELCMPGNGAAITTTPQLVFSGSLDGHMRAHDTGTGEVVWAFDTAREFTTVGGGKARGGAMEGAASAVLDGDMLFFNSGYLFTPRMPGNLFVAFELE